VSRRISETEPLLAKIIDLFFFKTKSLHQGFYQSADQRKKCNGGKNQWVQETRGRKKSCMESF